MLPTTSVLAHQGGWDEALMLLSPVALFVVLYRVAVKRDHARRNGDAPDGGAPHGKAP